MSKHWDYEDDHDWEDDVDYKSMDYVYWYGKYVPKEDIDALYDKSSQNDSTNYDAECSAGAFLLGTAVVGLVIYGAIQVVPHINKWCKEKARARKNESFVKRQCSEIIKD